MKRLKYFLPAFAIISLIASYFILRTPILGNPVFYLGTDRSFGAEENAYVNLEGNGRISYEFRVYRIADPKAFLTKKVKERLVQEDNENAFGNPLALFSRTLRKFQSEFRGVARREFNSNTRSELKKVFGVDYEAAHEQKPIAIPAILADQELISTFSVPTVPSSWAYRRIPVPVRDNGVYLVEGVSGSNLAYTILIKSGINFLVKQSDSETLLFVGRKDTGEPIPSADLTLFSLETGAPYQTAKTDSDGIYFYKGKSPVKSLVLAYKNGEFAVSDPEFYSSSFYGEGGARAFLYTDRPVYRPGDKVSFKGIVRNFTADQYRTLSGPGTVSVRTGQGEVPIPVIPISVSTDSGTFSGEFQLPESENVFLGNYSLILRFKDKSFQTEFSVEAYKKPTFLVTVSVPKSNYLQKEEIVANVKARYYYGQALTGKDVSYRVFRRPKFDYSPVGKLNFDSSADYLEQAGQSDRQELVANGKGKLDSQGSYQITFKPGKIENDFTYSIIASVQSEDMTLDGATSFSVNRSAFFLRIGKDNSVYEPGKEAKLLISLIPFDKSLGDENKKSVVGGKKIELTLYNREIRFSSEGGRTKISKRSVTTSQLGIAETSFIIPQRGQYVISAESTDANGNITKSETFFWASSVSDSIEIPFKDITLKPGKDLYSTGETAEILVLTPISNGHIVLTVEGNRIFKKDVIRMKGNALKYSVKITSDMSPNFTLSAVQFSGNDVYKSQVRVAAPPEEKFLKVDLSTGSKVYRPGDKAEIRIKTTGLGGRGIPAELSIAVVDEAIYQIKEEKTPNIGTFFYHPRRNNVQTSLASAYKFFGYSESKRLKLALGKKGESGYSSIKNEEQTRDKFKDTGFWNSKVRTSSDGTAIVTFTLPDNLTSWRITAIAVTPDTKVGRGQTSFVTRKDLMLLSGMPRYILKGETQKVSATVSNQSGRKLPIKVSVKTDGAKIVGSAETDITLEPGQNRSVQFQLQALQDPKIKSAKIILTAVGGGFSDSLRSEIQLKTWGLQRAVSDSLGMSEGDGTGLLKVEAPKELADPKLEVRVSPAVLPALRQSLEYLADYPYGCVEQTMSRFYPLLSVQKAGFINERLRRELPKMLEAGLKRVGELQRTDGGFGWFEGMEESDIRMSAYVYRGLAISQKNGAKIQTSILYRAKKFLYTSLDSGSLNSNVKAYVIASLSEAGNLEDSIVDGLLKSAAQLNTYGKSNLALILANKGRKEEASSWYKKGIEESGFAKKPFVKFTSYGHEPNWESDKIETIATLLRVGLLLGESSESTANLASSLLSNRVDLAWNNSRDTSAAVLALSEFMASIRDSESPATLEIIINGAPLKTITVSAKADATEAFRISITPELVRSGENRIEIKKKDGPVLYATASLYFTDRSKKISSYSNGIKVKRNYLKVTPDFSGKGISVSETRNFQSGDLVLVELKVEKEGNADSYFLVEDVLLPGFSFLQRDAEYFSGDRKIEYQGRQIYDDRAVFFVAGPKREFTVRYFLRAEVEGKYKTIPARASLMYYPEVMGATSDDEITIR